MSCLTADAADAIRHMREMRVASEPTLRLMEHLFNCPTNSEMLHSLLDGKHQAVAVTLFKTTQVAHSAKLLGFVLRFFADLVLTCSALGEQLGAPSAEDTFGDDPAKSFLYLVVTHRGDLGVTDPALFLAATALRYGPKEKNAEALQRFFAHVTDVLSAETLQVSAVAFAVQGCAIVARNKALRHSFFEQHMVQFLPRLLFDVVANDSASIIQLIYVTLLVSWLLSYEYEGVAQLQQYQMIPHIHRVLQRLQKEKCLRVALMTLWNMVAAERRYMNHISNPSATEWVSGDICDLCRVNDGKGPAFIAEMVGVGMIKTLAQLSRRKFGDEDIGILITELKHVLEHSMEKLTSFSEYRGEVLSGELEWSPVHTSVKFWKENAMQFENNEYEVLAALGKIIMTTHQDLTLAVACYDLGEVVRHHPTGKALLLLPCMEGVKGRVMSLMSHANAEVAKNALLAVQKIMVQRWEYIQEEKQK
ncbi:putative ATP synthase [Trypanosoma conorhini]|uniref:V-type proton ATPase subunit H n=1 Tax=Trypanosoma conorhini TaxID=83891 RepID=A0A422Q3A7_9TRYP|nr:putative ATP synthase [Trypanosoma conorhini]RNF24461.1 putative ATP synthase [Trypanosoma conorhini]